MNKNFKNDIEWRELGTTEEPILFLHAMAGSATAWQPQMQYFSGKYRPIAWDMPGFGKSLPLPAEARMAETVNVLKDFISNVLKLEKLHLVGLSVGGMILQHFAVAHPELVKSLVILDSSPKFGLSGDMKPEEFIKPMIEGLEGDVSVAKFSDGMIRAIVGSSCSEQVKLNAIEYMSRATKQGLKLTTHLIGEHDAMNILPLISAPTMVMVGTEDKDTPPDYARAIANAIPDAEMVVIKKAGHLSNLENSLEVNQYLDIFFAKHS